LNKALSPAARRASGSGVGVGRGVGVGSGVGVEVGGNGVGDGRVGVGLAFEPVMFPKVWLRSQAIEKLAKITMMANNFFTAGTINEDGK